MTTQTLELNNIERKIFWALVSLLSLAAAFYLYSVLSLTLAAVDRDSMNKAAHELASTVSALEAKYLSQENAVTVAYARSLGFHETNAKFAEYSNSKFSLAR